MSEAGTVDVIVARRRSKGPLLRYSNGFHTKIKQKYKVHQVKFVSISYVLVTVSHGYYFSLHFR